MRKIGVCCLFLLLAVLGQAQTPMAMRRSAAKHRPPVTSETITLGESAVALAGQWRFHPGDSPAGVANKEPLWAQPDFEDTSWPELDVESREGTKDPFSGVAEYVPGWTARGFPHLYGYAWYRLRIKLKDPAAPVWLKMPSDVDDAYQVFANGNYLGQFGTFHGRGVTVYSARALSFPLPKPDVRGELVLALRFYMESDTALNTPEAGGMHQAPVIGLANTIELMQASDDDAIFHGYIVSGLLQAILLAVAGFAALWAWLLGRHERAYLWLVLVSWVMAAAALIVFLAGATYVLPDLRSVLLLDAVLSPLVLPCWTMFWWYWFGLKGQRWLLQLTWAATAVLSLGAACLRPPLHSHAPFFHWAAFFQAAVLVAQIVLGSVLLTVVIRGIRKNRTEGLLALVPVLLLAVSVFGTDLLLAFHLGMFVFPYGLRIGLTTIANVLLYLAVSILVIRRLLAMRAAQQAVALELHQASELQHRVLVQESLPLESRFTVECEYLPAQVVGGDFFQILPRKDSSMLVVAGDVSGKGITAAMMVAVLVGAIRTEAEYTSEPARMLEVLNERLHGRMENGFATCMVACFQSDGWVELASAGHLPPYLNGQAIGMQGALPLGLALGIVYGTERFQMEAGDRLTFLSDGVVEATNEHGDLFGFDRAQQASELPASAIAELARQFGQCDDITVLTVSFAGQPAAAAAMA